MRSQIVTGSRWRQTHPIASGVSTEPEIRGASHMPFYNVLWHIATLCEAIWAHGASRYPFYGAQGYITALREFRVRRLNLQQPHRNNRARLRVCQRVVMIREIIPAGGGDGLELVVGEGAAEGAAGGGEGVVEAVVWVVHAIDFEDRFQAAFVEAGVVRHEGETVDERGDLGPYRREGRCIFRVLGAETMDTHAEPLVVLRLRVN